MQERLIDDNTVILLVFRRLKSQYSNMRKYDLPFWILSIVVTIPHSTILAAVHISNVLRIIEVTYSKKSISKKKIVKNEKRLC